MPSSLRHQNRDQHSGGSRRRSALRRREGGVGCLGAGAVGGASGARVLRHLPRTLALLVVAAPQVPRLLVDGVEELGLLAVGGLARAVAVVILCKVEHEGAVVVDKLARGQRDARARLHGRAAVDVVAVDAVAVGVPAGRERRDVDTAQHAELGGRDGGAPEGLGRGVGPHGVEEQVRAVCGPARHHAVGVDEARGEALAVRDGVVEPEHAQVEVAARRGPVGEVDRGDGRLGHAREHAAQLELAQRDDGLAVDEEREVVAHLVELLRPVDPVVLPRLARVEGRLARRVDAAA
eukprot:scaffold8531_cov62-Phaeocystis_antarctica.AAC.4